MQDLISLTATARLIKQLGDQLISDEMVAILELIKNSYDADATKVEVFVDTKIETEYGKGKIIIKDNGNGMVPSIIKESFLKLSTGFKEVEKISPYFKRRVLGKKGIGRLSFQRLGKFIKVYTEPRIERLMKNNLINEEDIKILEEYNRFYIEMDWYNLDFEKNFTEIKAKLNYEYTEEVRYGTYIEILGINNLDFWTFNSIKEKEMKKSISSMMNPFLKNKKSRFLISIVIDENPIKADMYDEETLQRSSDCEVNFEFKDWKLSINIKRTHKYFISTIDEKIKKMKNFKLLKNNYEKNEEEIQNRYNEKFVIDFLNLDEIKKKYTYLENVVLDTIIDSNGDTVYANPGEFKGKIYAINRSSSSYSSLDSIVESKTLIKYGVENRKDIFNVWDSANGIYVFRNDFRILPYGDGDWNNLSTISQRKINNIFKPHNVSGYIQLDGISSENLEEQTNREGFIQDQYGNNFFTIVNSILIALITRSDNEFNDGFNVSSQEYENDIIKCKNGLLEYRKEIEYKKQKEEHFEKIESEISVVKNDLKNEVNENLNVSFFDNENVLKKYKGIDNKITSIESLVVKLKDDDIRERRKLQQEKFIAEQKLEELQGLYPLIAQGIIVETMTHEMSKIEKNIKYYSSESIKLLQKKSLDVNQIISNMKLIIDETYYLKEQLNHLEPTYTKNRAKVEDIDIKGFLSELYMKNGPMYRKALNNRVKVIIEGDSFIVRANKGYLITIFDNLFINSLYWVEFENNDKYVFFRLNASKKVISIRDSGPGINNKVETTIFEPFVTTKPLDEGRGLGLYIIKELLISMNCSISLGGERVNGRLKEFIINLSGINKGD